MIAVPEVAQPFRQNINSVPMAFIEHRSEWMGHTLGRMNLCCSGCQALHWEAERPQYRTSARAGTLEACCKYGDAIVEKMRPLREPLNSWMTGQDGQSTLFRSIWVTGMLSLHSHQYALVLMTVHDSVAREFSSDKLRVLFITSKVLWFHQRAGIRCTDKFISVIPFRLHL